MRSRTIGSVGSESNCDGINSGQSLEWVSWLVGFQSVWRRDRRACPNRSATCLPVDSPRPKRRCSSMVNSCARIQAERWSPSANQKRFARKSRWGTSATQAKHLVLGARIAIQVGARPARVKTKPWDRLHVGCTRFGSAPKVCPVSACFVAT